MKKFLSVLLALVLVLTACNQANDTQETQVETTTNETTTDDQASTDVDTDVDNDVDTDGDLVTIDTLTVQFVPSRDPEEIMTQTEPLSDLLIEHLRNEGYDVQNVDISVGTTYEATGEALSAGSIDVGLIPGGTYVLYDDGAEVLLTATRLGYNNDSENAQEWNENKPTEQIDEEVTYYRSMILAGPSEKGQELANKVNSGEELTWEDLNSARWGVRSISSSAGYIYPYLWLEENYGQGITDLANVVEQESYNTSLAQLATGQLDVIVAFTDARIDNAENWVEEYNGPNDIWEDTNVIGITDRIYNDTVSVARNSQSGNITDEFKEALANAFINLAQTDEGREVISIYNHLGYQRANPSDYDTERDAQELMRELSSN